MTDQILGKTSEIMDYGRARRVDKTKDLINGRHDALIDSETECLDYTDPVLRTAVRGTTGYSTTTAVQGLV